MPSTWWSKEKPGTFLSQRCPQVYVFTGTRNGRIGPSLGEFLVASYSLASRGSELVICSPISSTSNTSSAGLFQTPAMHLPCAPNISTPHRKMVTFFSLWRRKARLRDSSILSKTTQLSVAIRILTQVCPVCSLSNEPIMLCAAVLSTRVRTKKDRILPLVDAHPITEERTSLWKSGLLVACPSTLLRRENTAECGPHSSGRSKVTGEHSLESLDTWVPILSLVPTCCVVTRNALPSFSCLKYGAEHKFQTEKIVSTIQTYRNMAAEPRASTEYLQ